MDFYEIKDRTEDWIKILYKIWETSVKATHLFLSEEEIKKIAEYVPDALREIPHLIVAVNEHNIPTAFMGVEKHRLEMLFISPGERGKGIGKQLLQYAIQRFSVNELCVNEQNPQAKGFYQHMGFHVYKRTELDEQGNPYPLLYMITKEQ